MELNDMTNVNPAPVDLDEPNDHEEADVYSTGILFGVPGWNDDLVSDLKGMRADIDRVLELMEVPDVEFVNSDYDHHDGGTTILTFETFDATIAQKYGFEDVRRAGADDSEPTPWNHSGRFWAWAAAKETGPNTEMPAGLKELLKDNMSIVNDWIAKKLGVPEGTTVAAIAQSVPAVQA